MYDNISFRVLTLSGGDKSFEETSPRQNRQVHRSQTIKNKIIHHYRVRHTKTLFFTLIDSWKMVHYSIS
jgi:hypothetical protein